MNTNGKTITFFTIIIAIVGIISPIAWEWWSAKSSITLTHLKTTKIIEKKASVDGLEIFYHNNKVNNLSKILFKIENTGRLPIEREDLIDIIEISFTNGKVLDTSIEETLPSNINANVDIQNNKVHLTFKLLNSKDTIIFGILIDSVEIDFNAKARIKNIPKLELQELEDQVVIINDVSWTVYIVGSFTVLFLLVTMVLLSEINKKKVQLRAIRDKVTPIHTGESIDIIKNYISNDLGFLHVKSKKNIKKLLEDETDVISDNKSKELLSAIEDALNNEDPVSSSIVGFVITSIGIWYVIDRIFV